MKIKCPICGAEYSEGTVKFCTRCMYSIDTDVYLNDLLNHPSIDELKLYNDRIKEYRALWSERNAEKKRDVSGFVEMVLVEGGTFTMGCTSEQSDCGSSEEPTHQVTLSSFLIGKTEVTLSSFEQFINETGYQTDADEDGGTYIWKVSNWELRSGVNWRCDKKGNRRSDTDKLHPVIYVSWNDAVAFCNWLSEKEGLRKAYSGSGENIRCDFTANGYRLPTEAEWEYAARGGNKSRGYKYSGSNDLDAVGWYGALDNTGNRTREEETSQVAKKQANELGIYDMSGNVWEWCWDWYDKAYYGSSPQTDPRGPNSGSRRVFRGGGWYSVAEACRVAVRVSFYPRYRDYDLGFRLVRTKN